MAAILHPTPTTPPSFLVNCGLNAIKVSSRTENGPPPPPSVARTLSGVEVPLPLCCRPAGNRIFQVLSRAARPILDNSQRSGRKQGPNEREREREDGQDASSGFLGHRRHLTHQVESDGKWRQSPHLLAAPCFLSCELSFYTSPVSFP